MVMYMGQHNHPQPGEQYILVTSGYAASWGNRAYNMGLYGGPRHRSCQHTAQGGGGRRYRWGVGREVATSVAVTMVRPQACPIHTSAQLNHHHHPVGMLASITDTAAADPAALSRRRLPLFATAAAAGPMVAGLAAGAAPAGGAGGCMPLPHMATAAGALTATSTGSAPNPVSV